MRTRASRALMEETLLPSMDRTGLRGHVACGDTGGGCDGPVATLSGTQPRLGSAWPTTPPIRCLFISPRLRHELNGSVMR